MPTAADSNPNHLPCRDVLLTLDLSKQHVSVNFEQPSITIGRDTQNRLVVNHPKVSRIHARIQMIKDGFVLTDHSSNGTYVHPDDSDIVVLKRGKWILKGDGTIYLGKAATPDAPNAIRYHIV